MSRRTPVTAMIGLVVACCAGPAHEGDGGLDASFDAAVDAGPVRDAGVDAGPPVCASSCASGETCCEVPDAGPMCLDLVRDVQHCGACGLDCVASGRGDGCARSRCTCGDFDLGCLGTVFNSCCVPAPAAGDPYCANLARDPRNCGACFAECEPAAANRCDGMRCVCGLSRSACAGTPSDRCCPDQTETYGCVDTTRDPRHCGDCGVRCPAALVCVDGACVAPAAADAGA